MSCFQSTANLRLCLSVSLVHVAGVWRPTLAVITGPYVRQLTHLTVLASRAYFSDWCSSILQSLYSSSTNFCSYFCSYFAIALIFNGVNVCNRD